MGVCSSAKHSSHSNICASSSSNSTSTSATRSTEETFSIVPSASTSATTSTSASHSTSTPTCTSASHSHWSSRPSRDAIFKCSNAQLHDLIVNHPEWIDVNAKYPRTHRIPDPVILCDHHLLSYAVLRGDVERIKILTQHPYIQLNINQLNRRKLTALVYVDRHDDALLAMRLISLLSSLGADPNNPYTLSSLLTNCSSPRVIRHFLFTFHPMNYCVSCTIPLDLTRTHLVPTRKGPKPYTIFQWNRAHSKVIRISRSNFNYIIKNINQNEIYTKRQMRRRRCGS